VKELTAGRDLIIEWKNRFWEWRNGSEVIGGWGKSKIRFSHKQTK
jgi:hypothetical protein